MTKKSGCFCVQIAFIFYICLCVGGQICFAADNTQTSTQQKSPMTVVTEQTTASNVTLNRSANDDKLIRQLFDQSTYKNFKHYTIVKSFEIKEPA